MHGFFLPSSPAFVAAPEDESRISCQEILTVLEMRAEKEKEAKKVVAEMKSIYDGLKNKANPRWRGVRK